MDAPGNTRTHAQRGLNGRGGAAGISTPRFRPLAGLITPLLAVLLLPAAACAQSAVTPRPLNDTGILFCGDAISGNAACSTTPGPAGQDARYGRDVAAQAGALFKQGSSADNKGFDYTRICNSGEAQGTGSCVLSPTPVPGTGLNDWACTRDNVTGLMWRVATTSSNVDAAIANAATLNNGGGLCGSTQWRLPTIHELHGLVDYGRTAPAIDPDWFPGTQPNEFWSASPDVSNAINAWYVDFGDGGDARADRGGSKYIRLVSGGQPLGANCSEDENPDGIYEASEPVSGESVVLDRRTGLMWKRCEEGQTWDSNGSTCSGLASGIPWADAPAAAATANSASYAGHSDWRLPNIRELKSLVDHCVSNGMRINQNLFSNTSSGVWSGSPHAYNSDGAWRVSFGFGYASIVNRNLSNQGVRLVRAGQSFEPFAAGDQFAPGALSSFTDVSTPTGTFGQSLDVEHQTISGTITSVTGIRISASDGLGGAEYRIQKAGQTTWSPWTSAPSAVGVGDKVQVRLRAGPTIGDLRTATLDVGGTAAPVSADFKVTAIAAAAAAVAIPTLSQWGTLLLTGLLGLISLGALRRREDR